MSTMKELIEITADVILDSDITRENLIIKLNKLIELGCKREYFKGDCENENHWYAGEYSQGRWIRNKCKYCGLIEKN